MSLFAYDSASIKVACVFSVSERVKRILTGLQNVSQSRALYVSCVFVSVFSLYLREASIYACGSAISVL